MGKEKLFGDPRWNQDPLPPSGKSVDEIVEGFNSEMLALWEEAQRAFQEDSKSNSKNK